MVLALIIQYALWLSKKKSHSTFCFFTKKCSIESVEKQQVQDNLKSLTTAVIKVQYLCYNILSRRSLFIQ